MGVWIWIRIRGRNCLWSSSDCWFLFDYDLRYPGVNVAGGLYFSGAGHGCSFSDEREARYVLLAGSLLFDMRALRQGKDASSEMARIGREQERVCRSYRKHSLAAYVYMCICAINAELRKWVISVAIALCACACAWRIEPRLF